VTDDQFDLFIGTVLVSTFVFLAVLTAIFTIIYWVFGLVIGILMAAWIPVMFWLGRRQP